MILLGNDFVVGCVVSAFIATDLVESGIREHNAPNIFHTLYLRFLLPKKLVISMFHFLEQEEPSGPNWQYREHIASLLQICWWWPNLWYWKQCWGLGGEASISNFDRCWCSGSIRGIWGCRYCWHSAIPTSDTNLLSLGYILGFETKEHLSFIGVLQGCQFKQDLFWCSALNHQASWPESLHWFGICTCTTFEALTYNKKRHVF